MEIVTIRPNADNLEALEKEAEKIRTSYLLQGQKVDVGSIYKCID